MTKNQRCGEIKRAVYGLKTSPREWKDCFAKTLTKKLGMTRSRIDANLITKTVGKELAMILVYVDDLFIRGPHDKSNEMLRLLQEHFTMKQTGELTEGSEVQFLGRTIKRDLDSISFMSQHWSICWASPITEKHESHDRVHHLQSLMTQTL